ncbi:unnamed protein product [Psylliodes chrysocephalus]|uniref:Uncharacterized protein n=1 Tax=Psylliodes chrysocephalus TaxID=3402493 RepID=A0A9P0GHB3_9CUCU|nr:unnamed protein product [Psylliodes chrysocephala]
MVLGNMSVGSIAFLITFTVVFSCFTCELIRRNRKRKRRYEHGPTVTVTTTTQQSHLAASPQVIPPYPINARHPTPANAPGFTPHHPPYPTHAPSMPFPQAPSYGIAPPAIGIRGGLSFIDGGAPYPPAPYQSTDYSANPPPYDVAVAQPPIQPPSSKDSYQKQSPYNPGYN